MRYDYSEYVPLMKALADETRLRIIGMLSKGELCGCRILEGLHITQPTLSYHMKILTECELVVARKEGIWMNYRLNTERVTDYKTFINELLKEGEDVSMAE